MQTPTLISWSLRVEQQLSPNTSLTVGYVGSHGYHEIVGVDANEPTPVICPASPCPAVFPTYDPSQPTSATNSPTIGFPIGSSSGGSAGPGGDVLHSRGHAQAKRGHRQYLDVVFQRRQLLSCAASGPDTAHQPGLCGARSLYLVENAGRWGFSESNNRRETHRDWSPIRSTWQPTKDSRHSTFDTSASSTRSTRCHSVADKPMQAIWKVGKTVWSTAGRSRASSPPRSGFPFTPQLSYNPSNSGDTRNPVRPFLNPRLQGQCGAGNASQWFNPAAFIAPPSASGFFGNVGRDTYIGPGLATWDFSVLKTRQIRERLSVQFRAEIFNILNRANFNTPNLIVFTPPTATNLTGLSGTAGAITSTSTTHARCSSG